MLSTQEPTWNAKLKQHTCCGSPHSYHAGGCPLRKARIPGRSSDPDFVRIQTLKAENPGITSGEVAHELKLPLDQVNEMWTV